MSGNAWDILRTVCDAIGLTAEQRSRLEPAVKLVSIQVARAAVSQYQETHGRPLEREVITALRDVLAADGRWHDYIDMTVVDRAAILLAKIDAPL